MRPGASASATAPATEMVREVSPDQVEWFKGQLEPAKRAKFSALPEAERKAITAEYIATAQEQASQYEPEEGDQDYVAMFAEGSSLAGKVLDLCMKSPNLCNMMGGPQKLAGFGMPIAAAASVAHGLNTFEVPGVGWSAKNPINKALNKAFKKKAGPLGAASAPALGPDGKPVENAPKKIATIWIIVGVVAVVICVGVVAYFLWKKKADAKKKAAEAAASGGAPGAAGNATG